MNRTEHDTLRETLDFCLCRGAELDAELAAHVAECPACQRERSELERLQELLTEARVAVHPEFAPRLAGKLPARAPAAEAGLAASWSRPWVAAAALIALFVVGATLFGMLADVGPGASLLATMGDFVATSLLAGAGLLGASWRGVGMAVSEWLGAAVANLVLALVLVLGLNVLAFRLLRRRRATLPVPSRDRDS